MRHVLVLSAAAAAIALPTASLAQRLPTVIAVVDVDRVTRECNACKPAAAWLRSEAQSLQAREKVLEAPLKTEAQSIQAAIDALAGKQPDAALQARIKAFQAKQQAGAAELGRKQEELKRNQQYIQQQIRAELGPIYTAVMQRRGANMMVELGSTLATTAALDVTDDVLVALNAAVPTITIGPPAQAEDRTTAPPIAQDQLDNAKTKCADLGFKPGTEKFGQCVLRVSE